MPASARNSMVRRLGLYCGHTVEHRAHRSKETIHSAFGGAITCVECGRDPSTVIDARAIGPAAPSPYAPTFPAVRKPSRAALERRIEQLEAEVTRLRDDADRG